MITEFDKSGRAEFFSKRFVECFDDGDYENAFDYMLKYSEAVEYPEFHMAAGMLYALMSLNSDDSDLLYMAYREFMMYLRLHPDCAHAYRNVLAVDFLRVDTPDLPRYLDWFRRCGIDSDEILAELVAMGIISSALDPPELEYLFGTNDFGSIYPSSDAADRHNGDRADPDSEVPVNKIIQFRGQKSEKKSDRRYESKITNIDRSKTPADDGDIYDDESDGKSFFDRGGIKIIEEMLSAVGITPQTDDGYKKHDEAVITILQRAEMLYAEREFSAALSELAKVQPSDPRYYIALCLKALSYMELGETEKTSETIEEALELRSDGALIGTIQCEFYERMGWNDRIPAALEKIDVADFMNGEHVFKAAYLALRHCTEEQAAELIESYIDEFNMLDMRLIYAQLLYNRGEREEALEEMYLLSRLFYDDILVKYFYLLARSGIDKMPLSDEMPQELLSSIVEAFMTQAENSDKAAPDDDTMLYGAEFFLTLEFQNEKSVLRRMLNVVRIMSSSPVFENKMRDTLVSPYAEPIVKAIALSAFMEKDPTAPFLFVVKYRPYSDRSLPTLEDGYRKGIYRGYAFSAVMLDGGADAAADFIRKTADKLKDAEADESEIAYFIVKHAYAECGVKLDDRLTVALGCKSKAAANRTCALLDKRVRNVYNK